MIKRISTYSKCFILNRNHISCDLNCLWSYNVRNAAPNLTLLYPKKLHISSKNRTKIFVDAENAFAYNILPELLTVTPLSPSIKQITTIEDLEQFLKNDWRASSASAIVAAFEQAQNVCVSHNINLSDKRFDALVDGLMDHCEKLTDKELLRLVTLLSDYPPCETINSHNFHDVWSCLDDICCWKMGDWNLKTKFSFANAWYKLNLGRISDYVYEVLDRLPKKADRLSKTMLLYTFFHINVCRRRSVSFEFEYSLARQIDRFSVDELGIIAMGYFKTRSKVKLKPILTGMMRKVIENRDTVHEITLTALLKTIRLSQNIDSADEIPVMLDQLTGQVERLSNLSCVHLALVGTGLQIKHDATLSQCIQKILKDIETVRLKDIERVLLAASMFNFDCTPSLYAAIFEELHKDKRRKEFIQYNRCLPAALNYLSLRKMYSYSLMDEVLNEEFIHETYGKQSKLLPRELFSLDACIDIECPDYQGNRLTPVKKYKAAKWLTEYTPTHDQWKRLTLSDRFYLDVVDHVKGVVGRDQFLRSDHVLPHFSKSDIIVCKDKNTGQFVEALGFDNYVLGDIKVPLCLEKYEWYALVVVTPNLTIRNTSLPLGGMLMKQRQLRTIGYTPIFIVWNQFTRLSTAEKTELIASKL